MHIQDPSQAKELVPHWGYADRVLPCVNDAGTCAYLDSIYRSHDLSMLYSFVLWSIVAGILVIWLVFHMFDRFNQSRLQKVTEVEALQKKTLYTLYSRVTQTVSTFVRRYLYPRFPGSYFGHISRLQVLVLTILSAYITIFSLVGITYKSWITPHKNDPNMFDTRTGFAGFADRSGVFAFALTPLTIFLSTRESILSLITGISYQHFNFLHRWTGRLIFIQASLHTFGWLVIKGCLYQPQPSTFKEFIIQPYTIWGCAAIILLVFIFVFSINSVIQWTGYEFFLISHLLAAIVFIVACWKHWPNLECWIIASLVILLLDFALRTLQFFLIHFKIIGKQKGVVPAQAKLTLFDDFNGGVLRLDFEHAHRPWKAGQHFFLTFPALSIWQSHPFTVAWFPRPQSPIQRHSYIIRCHTGETAKLYKLATTNQTTPVLLSGPCGVHRFGDRSPNVLAISGGTGISFTIPIIFKAAARVDEGFLQLVWIIRRVENLNWVQPELEALKSQPHVHIRILVTGGKKQLSFNEEGNIQGYQSEKSNKLTENEEKNYNDTPLLSFHEKFDIVYLNCRPKMEDIILEYLNLVESGRILVVGSGPTQMGMDARRATANFNQPEEVWMGDERKNVDFYWDY